MDIEVSGGYVRLPGSLVLPSAPRGLVVFAHGSGSSWKSPRNIKVARTLNSAGFATLLFDLLQAWEADERENVFDIALLTERLVMATRWLRAQPTGELARLPFGFFGASTGAAAALSAACKLGPDIQAIVSRGGRPDLAIGPVEELRAPTLLLVGGEDDVVLKLNRSFARRLPQAQLLVIPGATHLFEEPGTLEEVAQHATNWFTRHLCRKGSQKSKDEKSA